MGYSVDFPGSNSELGVHPDAQHNVNSLKVFRNGVCCVSCWEFSESELEEIIRTKRVFISIMSGVTQPPVYVGSETETRETIADYGIWKK